MAARPPVVETCDCGDVDAISVEVARASLLDPALAKGLADIFKALSDPTRLRVISALAERELCVNDLAVALEMSQSSVSHQLSDMRAMNLVSYRREGRHVFYRLNDEHVRDLFAQGLAHAQHQGAG